MAAAPNHVAGNVVENKSGLSHPMALSDCKSSAELTPVTVGAV
jgi:hypothetical protein